MAIDANHDLGVIEILPGLVEINSSSSRVRTESDSKKYVYFVNGYKIGEEFKIECEGDAYSLCEENEFSKKNGIENAKAWVIPINNNKGFIRAQGVLRNDGKIEIKEYKESEKKAEELKEKTKTKLYIFVSIFTFSSLDLILSFIKK
ncbi:hypothetical protein [Viridibacterium curvum]|uniref:Uncharacterized protein n=1 Tax=Viridibacterium curvum TaxID=1101404 RepID=A0ABP9QCE2_9RHOO